MHSVTPRELRLQAIERRFSTTQTKSSIKPIIPEKQVYSAQSEFTCGDQMSQEDFDFIMQNTQDVPIIDLVQDDDDEFNENEPLLKNKLPAKQLKIDERSILIEEMLTQEYCTTCEPSTKKKNSSSTLPKTHKNEKDSMKRKKINGGIDLISSSSSSRQVEVIVLDNDENEAEVIIDEGSMLSKGWKCNLCLEGNNIEYHRCSWCGFDR